MFEQQSGDFTIESMCSIIFTNLHKQLLTKGKGKKFETTLQYYQVWQEVLRMLVPIRKFEGIVPHGKTFLIFKDYCKNNTEKDCVISEEEMDSLDLLTCQSLKSLSIAVHGKGKIFFKRIGEITGRLDIESLTLEVLLCHSCDQCKLFLLIFHCSSVWVFLLPNTQSNFVKESKETKPCGI